MGSVLGSRIKIAVGAVSVLAVCAAAIHWWPNASKTPANSPEKRTSTSGGDSADQSSYRLPPTLPDAPPSLAGPEGQGELVPMVSQGAVLGVRVKVDVITNAENEIHALGPKHESNAARLWEDLVHVAAFMALELFSSSDVSLRVRADAGQLQPQLHQLAPLIVAIARQIAEKPYPTNILVAGVVAPDGQVIGVRGESTYRALATDNRFEYHPSRSVQQLVEAAQTKTEHAADASTSHAFQPALVPTDVGEKVLQSFLKIVGTTMNKKSSTLPTSEDWTSVLARLETHLQTAKSDSAMHALHLAQMGAAVRGAARAVAWSVPRIPTLIDRLIVQKGAPSSAKLAWLGALVRARLIGEHIVRWWTTHGPPKVERGKAIVISGTGLRRQTNRLVNVTQSLRRILRTVRPDRRTLPHTYPYNDIRNYIWTRRGVEMTRSSLADWGDHADRVSNLWSQLTIATTIRPKRSANNADPNWVTIDNGPLLTRILASAQSKLHHQLKQVTADERQRLMQVAQKRISLTHISPQLSTRRLLLLEQLWSLHRSVRNLRKLKQLIESK